jgi:short subunit dehydrogenase-like uncharacterized protein
VGGRIVLFGATGYTGRLTARALVDRGARPVLAGRAAARLGALAGELGGLETRVADAAAPETLRGLVQRGDVLLSTVGPFARLGEPAVAAAVRAGAGSRDSTGETAFIRTVFERHGPEAERAGCGLVTAFGYDWVPGNLAGALALREAGDAATRVDVGYFVTGGGGVAGASGGTRASAASIFLGAAIRRRGGRLVTEPVARHVRSFEVFDRSTNRSARCEAFSVGGSEVFTLPRLAPALRDVGVFVGWFGAMTRPLRAVLLGSSAVTRIPVARRVLHDLARRAVRGSTGGPDAARRARSGSFVVAEASDATGTPLSTVRLAGPNPYDLTAALLAWGAKAASDRGLRGAGALGPVDGFGLDALERGAAEAGLTRA